MLKFIIISRHLIRWFYSNIHLTICNLPSGQNSLVALGSNYFVKVWDFTELFRPYLPFKFPTFTFSFKDTGFKTFSATSATVSRHFIFSSLCFLRHTKQELLRGN